MTPLTLTRWRASVRPDGPNCTAANGSRWFWMFWMFSSSDPLPVVDFARESEYQAEN